jgi:hypothetical protein
MAGEDPVGFARFEQDSWQRLHGYSPGFSSTLIVGGPAGGSGCLGPELRMPEHEAAAGQGKGPNANVRSPAWHYPNGDVNENASQALPAGGRVYRPVDWLSLAEVWLWTH